MIRLKRDQVRRLIPLLQTATRNVISRFGPLLVWAIAAAVAFVAVNEEGPSAYSTKRYPRPTTVSICLAAAPSLLRSRPTCTSTERVSIECS